VSGRSDILVGAGPIRFGTSGVPRSLESGSHLDGITEVHRLGLSAMELAFVHRVNLKPAQAPEVRDLAENLDVGLSAHASYYINLNSPEADKVRASRQRLLSAARMAWMCGGESVVFHAGWRHDDSPEKAYESVRAQVSEIAQVLREEGVGIRLLPETTGKVTQFGDLDELLCLAQDIPGVEPCVDFAHLHARRGLMNTEEEFEDALTRVGAAVGTESLRRLHSHVSGIDYGPRGELRHLPLRDSDFNYVGLMRVLAGLRVAGRVICESPVNHDDAVLLAQTWSEAVAAVQEES